MNLFLTPRVVYYDPNAFSLTRRLNKVAKTANLPNSERIGVSARTRIEDKVTLRGDLAPIEIGQYCILGEKCTLSPPLQKYKNNVVAHLTQTIGDFVIVGENSFIESQSIGDCVFIGENVSIGNKCVINSCVIIEDNTILSPETVIPPFTRVKGNPPKLLIDDLSSSFQMEFKQFAKQLYANFQPK